jgi:hypothetical protein
MKIKFSYIVFTLSLAVASCAAYFSVWGLSQLFAGASLSVIIMASILEFGKIISTTALHKYWKRLATGLRIYLTISVVVLMIITSAGIYGFLSNAYQKTANKLEIHEGQVGVLDGKKQIFTDALTANNKIIDSKNKRIDQLSGLRTTQENRIDAARSNTSALRGDINSSNTEIQKLSTEIDALNAKNSVINDSISKYQTKALEVKSGSDVAGEVGPLKFVAELTGISMDRVVNYMILLLIFVFDPLAIALVLTTNRIFQIEKEDEDEAEKEKLKYKGLSIWKEAVNKPDDAQSDDVNEGVNIEEEDLEPYIIETQEPEIEEVRVEELIINEGVNEGVNEEEHEVEHEIETHIEEEVFEPVVEPIHYEPKKPEPVTKTGKIELEDIKEVKERRGYSVPIPEPRGNNSIDRIGNNKFIKNGDANRIIYKKDGNR